MWESRDHQATVDESQFIHLEVVINNVVSSGPRTSTSKFHLNYKGSTGRESNAFEEFFRMILNTLDLKILNV